MMLALKEARIKFLANLHIEIGKLELPKGQTDRRYATDFISEDAEVQLNNGIIAGLKFEHLVPKSRYITKVCEAKAETDDLTESFVRDLLNRYYWTATITDDEESRLSRTRMPVNWDEINIMARYKEADIILKRHTRLLTD